MLALPESLSTRLAEVRDVLMFSFDFEVLLHPVDAEAYATPSPWVPAFLVPDATVMVVGRDAMGGVYLSCESVPERRRCCLHLDTRGHVMFLDETLEQFLALLVALPYWHQLLMECPSGQLDDMRSLAVRLEQEVCEELPALPDARDYLRSQLELPVLEDPLQRLHELSVARSIPVTVMSPHGWRYVSPISASDEAALGA